MTGYGENTDKFANVPVLVRRLKPILTERECEHKYTELEQKMNILIDAYT